MIFNSTVFNLITSLVGHILNEHYYFPFQSCLKYPYYPFIWIVYLILYGTVRIGRHYPKYVIIIYCTINKKNFNQFIPSEKAKPACVVGT